MEYSLELCNSEKLTGLVTHYFCFSITSESREDRRMMPSGRQYILFILSGEVTFTFRKNKKLVCNKIVTIGGITDYSLSYHAQPGTVILGVSLLANGVFKLLGCDLRGLTAPKAESREFLKSNELQDVLHKLSMVSDRKQQYKIVETYLLSKTGEVAETFIDDAIQAIVDAKGDINTGHLAQKLSVNKEHLQDEFARETGIMPEKYINLIRFKYVFLEFVNGDLTMDELVMQHNYEGYAQLLQDFKQYTGVLPKAVQIGDFTSYNAYRKELKRLGIEFLI